MNRDKIFKILQRTQSDEQFSRLLEQGEPDKILHSLEQNGVHVDSSDVLDAINVRCIVKKIEAENSISGSSQSDTNQYQTVISGPQPTQGLKNNFIEASAGSGYDLGLELQKKLVGVIEQIDRGYDRIMMMYSIAFYLGVIMVLTSVFASLFLRSDTSAFILGGLGMAEIITSLIFRPAQSLQNNRSDLAQLQAAFINWINDIHNWNRYWNSLVSTDDEANRNLPAFNKVREVSDTLVHNTERMMGLVEQYCEIHSGHAIKNKREPGKEIILKDSE